MVKLVEVSPPPSASATPDINGGKKALNNGAASNNTNGTHKNGVHGTGQNGASSNNGHTTNGANGHKNGFNSNGNGSTHDDNTNGVCFSEVQVFNYGRLNSNIVCFVPKSHLSNGNSCTPLGIRKFLLFIKRVCINMMRIQ